MNSLEEEILAAFNSIKEDLIRWGKYVDIYLIDNILKEYIDEHLIKILPSYRIKDDKSFLFKALYRKKNYKNPIEKIEDKIGTRIIVLKSDDIKRIEEKILTSTGWKAKLTKSFDQEIEDKPNIFDYQSVHIVVQPSDIDNGYDSEIKNSLTCEIQIRTLLQHAFAEVSHDSTYKGPYNNDKEILRRLAKAMALMEATDDYFCNIFKLMSDEQRYYALYLKELISLYKQFNKDFDSTDLNHFVTESIFDLLEEQPISIPDLTIFIERHNELISKLIKNEKGLLFKQPSIILTLYYFMNKRTFLNDSWPLNKDVLKSIYKATSTSFENY
jgi:ppGpp synthetase/RelA/SpoT-type nucleotidyltranferase